MKTKFLTQGREQLDSPAALPTPEPTQQAVSYQSVAVAALQDEVSALRSEISTLQAQLAQCRNQSHGQSSIQPTCSDSPRRDFRVRNCFLRFHKHRHKNPYNNGRSVVCTSVVYHS